MARSRRADRHKHAWGARLLCVLLGAFLCACGSGMTGPRSTAAPSTAARPFATASPAEAALPTAARPLATAMAEPTIPAATQPPTTIPTVTPAATLPPATAAASVAPTAQAIPAAGGVSPCAMVGDAAGDGSTREAGAHGQAPSPQPLSGEDLVVRYDGETNTVELRKGSPATLAAVSGALNRPDALRELAPGEWLLSANLTIEEGAALRVAAPEVRWLKLRSDDEGFVEVKALGGRLEFVDTCVTSWDPGRDSFDENYTDGRSFVLARDGALMTIRGSELSYLGYDAHQSYGVAWRRGGTGGEIVDSVLAYNYYGLYSFEVSDLVIRGNQVHHNVLYGLDPHTRSMRLVIENNVAHHNGKHGIILAEECSDGIVRNNVTYDNLHHGIVIYQRSDNNLVEGNTSYGNGGHGININDASKNIVRGNIVYDNREVGIGVGQRSSENQVVGNTVRANRKDGIALYSDAKDNLLRDNTIHDNARYGIYVKSEGGTRITGNEIFGNAVGVYLNIIEELEVSRQDNHIYDNREDDLLIAEEQAPDALEEDQP